MKRLVTAIHRALKDAEELRKRGAAEERVKKQAELLNKANDAIIVTDLFGTITFWNAGAERILGWTAKETTGRRPQEFLGTDFLIGWEKSCEALAKCGEWHGEIPSHDLQGKLVVLEVSSTLVRDASGVPEAHLNIATDITEKKSMEEQFLRAQRLESIGMLASGIAHDLNNVLSPIFLAAPMLRENVRDPSQLRMITALERSAERGTGLVRQILSFAQGVGGPHELVDVRHLLRDTVSVIRETFPKNIALEDNTAHFLWPVMANATQIHQVLLNLCVNARDAMPAGGKLILRAENCMLDELSAHEIEGARPGAWTVLHVEDTGTGIPPQVLSRIWEPFFTTKEAGKGTGLGLPTVRGIVESHKGFLTLTTRPGRGTTFRAYFPAEVEAGASKAKSECPGGFQGNGELVLVVDDESYIRELATTILSKNGYRAISAKDGAQALAMFSMHGCDISVVLTDLSMPNLDGASLTRVVRELNPDVRVLVMSGQNSSARAGQIGALAAAFIAKPFKPQTLLENVNALLHPAAA